MEEPEENMNAEDERKLDSPLAVKKPKKRSIVERELETSLTTHVTSPAIIVDGLSTSRYGRARRLRTESELIESQKIMLASIKSPGNENTSVKFQPPVYRMHASNSPHKPETPKKALETNLDNQIDNIYQENISLSRFSDENGSPSPAKKFPKVYIRKDLIQKREAEETIMLIKNLFSPSKSATTSTNSPMSTSLEHYPEKYNSKQNGYVDNTSVVKALDFDGNKKRKRDNRDQKPVLSKNDLFEVEAKCSYQVGDLAWARMGTFPFWPCIVTRDPYSEMFVKRKLFGRIEHDIIHVTFLGDNGRRSWIVDNMLRNYLGQLEFEATREKFTPEDKKKDQRLYAAFFVSEKKQALWNNSVEEAENLLREPKRLRIDLFNDMLLKLRASKKNQKSGKITRTDSDVSLSESLYDSLFSEDDVKTDDTERSKNKTRNKSFDVSEVVTACLDNMAAKTGITKIQRQSHMDRWLQKAKSSTPEKTPAKPPVAPPEVEKVEKTLLELPLTEKKVSTRTKKSLPSIPSQKRYRFRKSNESQSKLAQIVHNQSKNDTTEDSIIDDNSSINITETEGINSGFCVITKVESLADTVEDINQNTTTIINFDDDSSGTDQLINEPNKESTTKAVLVNSDLPNDIEEVKQDMLTIKAVNDTTSEAIIHTTEEMPKENAIHTHGELSKPHGTIQDSITVNDGITMDSDNSVQANNEKPNYENTTKYSAIVIDSDIQASDISAQTYDEKFASDTSTKEVDGDTKNYDNSVQVNVENSDNSSKHPVVVIDIDTGNTDNSDQDKIEKSDPDKICRDPIMVVDVDSKSSDISSQARGEKNNSYEVNTNSDMDVNTNTNFKTKMNEENSILMSETVSNESVDSNKVELTDDNYVMKNETGLKEAQNVTIETSVTETKNDDNLNSRAEEEHQKTIDKPKISKNTETKVNNIDFLDESISHCAGISETKQVPLEPKNTSTPEKSKIYDKIENIVEKSNDFFSKKAHLVKHVLNFYETQNVHKSNDTYMDQTKNCCKSTKEMFFSEHSMSIDKNFKDADDFLDESGNSESILQLNNAIDDPENESCHTTYESMVNTSFNGCHKSKSIVSSQINESTDKNVPEVESTTSPFYDNAAKTNFICEDKHESSTRQYVESPTFTQLLESEEFFRDVNQTCDNGHNKGVKIDKTSNEQHESINELENKSQCKINNKPSAQNVDEDFADEDTSDDEPSPEYESLDEDITEDFRKHMLSIESNITDKKNEEQIVKICNEIAEKAKLSPTKYNIDVDVTNPKVKLIATPKNTVGANIAQQNKCNISVEGSTKEEKQLIVVNTTPKNTVDASIEQQQKFNISVEASTKEAKQLIVNKTSPKYTVETSIEKQNKCKISDEASTKKDKQSTVDKHSSSDLKSKKTHKAELKNNRYSKESDMKVNGNTSVKEIVSDKTKIMYRTRFSINKVRASPDIKLESSELEQLRKSCEYEPKVVIIPLERDPHGFSKVTDSKIKFLDVDKSKNKHSKHLLTLKRDSSESKHNETKSIKNSEPLTKLDESKDVKMELVVKEEDIVTMNKVPKKINIENGATETNIPEANKFNGNLHNVDRNDSDTPDLIDDTDFDIDAVSLNTEDSAISSTNSFEGITRRNLRSRPERTLENALKNPEFLKYLELKQDYLMDLHPELNADEVVSYVYKTWQYEEDLKSDVMKVDDAHQSNLVKGLKQETPSRKKSKKSQPKDSIENYFREKYEKCKKTFDFDSESGSATLDSETVHTRKESAISPVGISTQNSKNKTEEVTAKRKTRSMSPDLVALTLDSGNDVSIKSEGSLTPARTLRSKAITPKYLEKNMDDTEDKSLTPGRKLRKEREFDTESIDSEDSEVPLRQLRSKVVKRNNINKESTPDKIVDLISESKIPTLKVEVKEDADETASTVSENEPLLKQKKADKKSLEDPEFIKYLEVRQDALMDENPQLTQDEIISYMHKTWLYEENSKTDLKKNDELELVSLVKGTGSETPPRKKVRRKPKIEKQIEHVVPSKDKPRRRKVHPFYKENYSDIEDELEVFEILKTKKAPITNVSKLEPEKNRSPNAKSGKELESLKVTPKTEQIESVKSEHVNKEIEEADEEVEYVNEIESYFTELTKPKPNVFKGLTREKVCDICEIAGNLVKCKGCNGMFHIDCVKREPGAIEKEASETKGKKKKGRCRKPKSLEDSESHSDERSQDVSADMSIEDIVPSEICTFDANMFEEQLATKMKELLDNANTDTNYDSYSSDDGIDWKETVAGKCEIVEVKLKRRSASIDYSNFKCNNCQIHDVPVCFVCRSAVSKTNVKMRQKCHVAHCHKYYHLECLDHWPQTQFNSGEPSRNNKKINEFFEALSCPRHVCHTCVSDDPRGCKTRFSGDKLARCVRCPATYHSFNKCLPAGSQILTASHIICPRHSDNRSGKGPCHVNAGWCFICAEGGSLICCEYCPTSFHAECLNIKPPEGNFMCEDCETGRLPLYGEMVWVKLGLYRWWPGKVLHPSEIPENIMAANHRQGDFVVRFFGQYDHYWVNRGRVFPYQEGDSGRLSGQKSKLDEDFTTAIEHAQRAHAILKNAEPNEEESLDIASSLLPPHFVKLKCNKPCGSLCGRKVEDPSLSLTQCECNPDEPEPCGPYSQCLNRVLLTECGPTCRAGDRCNNRAFEKRLYPKLEPYRAPHRGWGLRTTENIKAGQFVIEYVGELIDEDEFKRRMRRKHEIRDENFYFLTLDKERMIDAGPKGNLARFMNHCCEPNCETQKWTVLGDIRVGLFAINDIPANSEVTFNYNLECAGIEKKRCLCGAKRCSGYIGAKPKQDESQTKKSKFGKLVSKRVYRKKKAGESLATSKIKPKRPVGRPPKPKELTEIEKDLLIIKNATNNISSNESSRRQSIEDKNPKSLKRKRVSNSTEEVLLCNGQEPSVKRQKCEEKSSEVGD